MAIKNYDKQEFVKKLNTIVFPSQPIISIEHLHGRQNELGRIEKALSLTGRHAFIFGDRGVGKSSLAASAANQIQSTDSDYIDISCSPNSTLSSIVANISYQSLKNRHIKEQTHKKKSSLDFKFLKIEQEDSFSLSSLTDKVNCLIDAVEILKEVSHIHSNNSVVVMDEFDRISSAEERNAFADLLKHLGDKRVNIKFIITGIATSLDELLGAHQSAYRQFETIELPRLGWEARWDIALTACNEFNIEVDRNIYIRIAAVSDGYPYYVQLITEKLLWVIFEDVNHVNRITWDHYNAAINDAIDSISAELKRPYEMVITQRSNDYEEVLWATADSEWLLRYIDDMYSSYKYIMQQIPDKKALDQSKFANRIRSLKKDSCGSILVPSVKKGLYSYKENMLRGYVRLQAEAQGIKLVGTIGGKEEKQYMKVKERPIRSKGYNNPGNFKGVHFGRKR